MGRVLYFLVIRRMLIDEKINISRMVLPGF